MPRERQRKLEEKEIGIQPRLFNLSRAKAVSRWLA